MEGSSPFCKIRKCVKKKDLDGCWECTEFETCNELEFLENAHGDAHIINLRNIKEKGKKDFINGKMFWYCPKG